MGFVNIRAALDEQRLNIKNLNLLLREKRKTPICTWFQAIDNDVKIKVEIPLSKSFKRTVTIRLLQGDATCECVCAKCNNVRNEKLCDHILAVLIFSPEQMQGLGHFQTLVELVSPVLADILWPFPVHKLRHIFEKMHVSVRRQIEIRCTDQKYVAGPLGDTTETESVTEGLDSDKTQYVEDQEERVAQVIALD